MINLIINSTFVRTFETILNELMFIYAWIIILSIFSGNIRKSMCQMPRRVWMASKVEVSGFWRIAGLRVWLPMIFLFLYAMRTIKFEFKISCKLFKPSTTNSSKFIAYDLLKQWEISSIIIKYGCLYNGLIRWFMWSSWGNWVM